MTLSFKHASALALASTLAIAGCVSAPQAPYGSGRGPAASSFVDGQWTDQGGIAISTFSGGAFQSVATDTGNKVSEGTYRVTGNGTVEISMTSLIRQTQSRINCALVTPTQLNCTNDSGQQFSLIRRG
ncbi:outer membrane lipoprotein Omp10 [Chelativorans composti]|jgi:hypothetical protein|uniref:Outer membrane lipoprotein n=1 Tax=Chelativorans composti TaxID=768533 RepID=A0ABW5DCT4_9HYPH